MSKNALASKVIILEKDPKVRGVPGAASSVAGAVGVAPQGPVNQAVLCTSFDDYEATFGGYTVSSDLALAAMGYFENGGNQLWVSRIASTTATPASVGLIGSPGGTPTPASITGTLSPPFTMQNGDTFLLHYSGGFEYAFNFQGYPAEVQTSIEGPFHLADGLTLSLAVDGVTRTATFSNSQFSNIEAATAAEVADVINAQITGVQASANGDILHVVTTSAGTASSLLVTGGTAVDSPEGPASATGTVRGPYSVDDLDTIIMTGSESSYSVQLHGQPAEFTTSSLSPPFDNFYLSDGLTLMLAVDGDAAQTVTFSTAQFANMEFATAPEVAAAIQAQVSGLEVQGFGTQLSFQTLSKGLGASIEVTGGTSVAGTAIGASVTGTTAAPYALADGDALLFAVNPGGIVGTTFASQPAQIQSSNGPFVLSDSMTLLVSVDGGADQTVTFSTGQFVDIAAATATEVASAMSGLTGVLVAPSGSKVNITTLSQGTDSTVAVTSGTAATALGLSGATDTGGGNVANIHAVTAAEVAARLTADGVDTYIQNEDLGTGMRFTSTSTGRTTYIQAYGSAAAKLGLDGVLHHGANTDRLGVFGQSVTGSGNVQFLGAVTVDEIISLALAAGAGAELVLQNVINTLRISTLAVGINAQFHLTGNVSTFMGFENGGYHYGTGSDRLGLFERSGTGYGSVGRLSAVTAADIIAIGSQSGANFQVIDLGNAIRIQTNLVGASSFLQIHNSSGTPAATLGFDTLPHVGTGGFPEPVVHLEATNPGVSGNRLSATVAESSSSPSLFDLSLYDDGTLVESFSGLSRDTGHPRFVEAVLNHETHGSRFVHATNLSPIPGQPPDSPQSLDFTGGNEGLGGLTDADFLGDEATATGLHALDAVQDLSILLVPGRATPAVHNGMLAYCEEFRDGTVFAVLDPPPATTAVDMVTYVTTTASLENASEYGAIYWPRVKVLNPNKGVFGSSDQISVPPSGIVAGVYARTDGARPGGIYDPPAGTEAGRMFGVLGFEGMDTLKERKRDLVYPHRINPLTTGRGLPFYIDGSRTLKADGGFPSIAERRGVIFIERSLKKALAFARHKKNDAELRAAVRRTITAFLTNQMNNGAFRSRVPSKSFFVEVTDALNPPSVAMAGKLNVRVGLAPNNPAEYVLLEISQDTRAFDAEV